MYQSGFSRETELVDIYKEIYRDESVHTIMEAEKSYSLLSASWKPRHVRGLIQSESEGLRTLGSQWFQILVGRQGKMERVVRILVSGRSKKGNKFFLPLPFVLFRPQRAGRCPPTFEGGYHLLGLPRWLSG